MAKKEFVLGLCGAATIETIVHENRVRFIRETKSPRENPGGRRRANSSAQKSRISDSADCITLRAAFAAQLLRNCRAIKTRGITRGPAERNAAQGIPEISADIARRPRPALEIDPYFGKRPLKRSLRRSEEHTSELQSPL